ncbi:hypothetical protein [Novosphingobium resinovorum]|uniref:hypothetical protein n=1 Tax=Novosphingobium resinovorum TaxID=158500 RepID=UPI002ED5CD86|nr:hypothetical protein [Novosphingobium resinovorum]
MPALPDLPLASPGAAALSSHFDGETMFADVIGERKGGGEKGACRIARLIEEDLIARGWPQQLSPRPETALADQFGVGRAVIREAMRILEIRGTARMIRGPKGGLRISEIDPRHTADVLIGFSVFFGISHSQLAEAEAALGAVAADIGNGRLAYGGEARIILELFDGVIRTLQQSASGADGLAARSSMFLAPENGHRSRAGQIAERILRECTAEQWARGYRLGSEEDLCFRYGADRDAFRQAVRILESLGAAETLCGRGRGLKSQAPRGGPVARLVSCFFASKGIRRRVVMAIFQALNVQILSLAARKASSACCDNVASALAELDDVLDKQGAKQILLRVFAAEEAMISVADNPILQVFAQSLRGYPSSHLPRDVVLLDAMNRQFSRLSQPVLKAFRTNDAEAAATAQRVRASALNLLSSAFPQHAHDDNHH